MAWRWVICPFELYTLNYPDGSSETANRAKVSTVIDPGRGKYFMHTAVLSATVGDRTWALCLVQGKDMAALDSDASLVNLFEGDILTDPAGFLDMTPAELGWNNARQTRIRNKMAAKGINTVGLVGTTPIYVWLERIGGFLYPGFDPKTLVLQGLVL